MYVFVFFPENRKRLRKRYNICSFSGLKKFSIIFVPFHIKEILLGFKFGYMSVRTVEKFGNHVTVWRHPSAYLSKYGNFQKKLLIIWRQRTFFLKKTSICSCNKALFLLSPGCEISPKTNSLVTQRIMKSMPLIIALV